MVTREAGSERLDLPIFTAPAGTVQLAAEADRRQILREDFPDIPGAFLLHNVLTDEECDQLIAASEAMGYTQDAPVSLGRHIRQNDNCVWIADGELNGALFERCRPHLPKEVAGGEPAGLNARWRLYRYNPDDVFRAHTDGSWPGSGLDPASGRLVQDVYGDRWSQLTWVAYLNDDFRGGATRFLLPGGARGEVPARRGAVLCFFHGEHPLSPVHEGSHVSEGTKYIIRSDVLYTIPNSGAGLRTAWR